LLVTSEIIMLALKLRATQQLSIWTLCWMVFCCSVRNLIARSQRKCRNCLMVLIWYCMRAAHLAHLTFVVSATNGRLGFHILGICNDSAYW